MSRNAYSIAAGLYARDITSFDPKTLPRSSELAEQKLRSLRGIDKWLAGVISAEHWQLEWKKSVLYDAYKATAGAHPLHCNIFYRDLGKRIVYKNMRKGAAGCGGNYIRFPPLADTKVQFARYLAISPDQLDEAAEHQEETEPAPAPAPAPAPLVAGDPAALLDVVCRLWQGRPRAASPPSVDLHTVRTLYDRRPQSPLPPLPPLQEQLNYEDFAADVRAHLAAGVPADVEPVGPEGPDEIIPGVPVFHTTADLMADIMATLPPI